MSSQKIKITPPSSALDQAEWGMQIATDWGGYPEDKRTWFERAIYSVLMYLHGQAEDVWSWSYRVSQRYAPPTYSALPVGQRLYHLRSDGVIRFDKEK